MHARLPVPELAALSQVLPAAIVGLDPQNLVDLWNPAAAAMFGWPAADVLGQPLPAIFDLASPVPESLVALAGKTRVRARTRNNDWLDVDLYIAPPRPCRSRLGMAACEFRCDS